MAVLRHVGCGLCFRTAAVLTLVSIALAVVMILYTDMRLRSRLDDIANTNTKPENQLEAETNVQTLVERMQARLDMLDEKARGVGREAGDTLYYDRCDLHATRDRAPPLIVMATTMGNSSADMKRKIRQNALRGFMAQTPPTAVRPMVFTDSAQVIAEVRAEMAKLDAAETTVLDFEQEHGWPTFAGMMKRAEAKAIELDAPFCKSGCKLPHFVLLLRLCRPTSQGAPLLTMHWHADGYANGDILFVRPLQIHFTLGCDHKASRSKGQKTLPSNADRRFGRHASPGAGGDGVWLLHRWRDIPGAPKPSLPAILHPYVFVSPWGEKWPTYSIQWHEKRRRPRG